MTCAVTEESLEPYPAHHQILPHEFVPQSRRDVDRYSVPVLDAPRGSPRLPADDRLLARQAPVIAG
jgi:hypothetical protein